VSGAAMQRLDGVTNSGTVPHDLRRHGLGVEQLVQGVIVAGDVAVGPGEVELVRNRRSAGKWDASTRLPCSTTQATSPRSKLAATRCSCTLVGPKLVCK
jgi:hypothetical protein